MQKIYLNLQEICVEANEIILYSVKTKIKSIALSLNSINEICDHWKMRLVSR